ncbi:magnesium/cobalt transporter CorA [Candidatus Latescibacterota bacterium]
MITIYSYDIANGILSIPEAEQLPELLETESADLWIDFEAPNLKESEILRSVFNFHELAIEDCIETDIEEAKLDDYEDYLFLVLHSIGFNSSKFKFNVMELDLFFGKNFVITYHKKPTAGIDLLKKRIERKIDFMAQGTDEILHAIVDSLVDNYVVAFKQLEKTIYKLETEILAHPTQKTFNDIFTLKIELINLVRILNPGEEVMESLGEKEHELIQEENKVYFQDVHDHISKIQGLLQSYMAAVSSTIDAYMSLSSHRMNKVMQTMTIIATIVLVPTLVASIYGMNGIDLPFQNTPHSFLIVIAMNVFFVGGMLMFFKKKDWF